jgi:hypothetical protein
MRKLGAANRTQAALLAASAPSMPWRNHGSELAPGRPDLAVQEVVR